MKILPYTRICVFLMLCLLLSNCTEDIPDPLTTDDVISILSPATTDSETSVTDTSGTNTSGTNSDTTDTNIDILYSDLSDAYYWISDTMEPGAWVEYKIYTFSGTRKDRLEYIGTDTYEGRECYVIEYDEDTTMDEGIEQIWIDKATGEVVLSALDEDGEIFVTNFGLVPDPIDSMLIVLAYGQESGTELYVTPTGKTADSTVYKFDSDEIWISDDIPFRLVKSLVDAEVDMALYNYADSGAERNITRADIENNPLDEFEDMEQEGEIIITVADGAQPDIWVSEPIWLLMIEDEDEEAIWIFQILDDNGLPGPFQYGVSPEGVLQTVPLGGLAPPDLVAGQMYEIMVIGGLQEGQIPTTGTLVFIR